MKFLKFFTLILAACLLCGSLMACDKGEDTETTADTTPGVETVAEMTIKLVVRADGEKKFDGEIKFTGLLGDAIEMFTMMESDYSGDCFDEHGILQNVCGIAAGEGQSWVAYYEDKGKINGAIPSIQSHGPASESGKLGLTEGCTIVLLLE